MPDEESRAWQPRTRAGDDAMTFEFEDTPVNASPLAQVGRESDNFASRPDTGMPNSLLQEEAVGYNRVEERDYRNRLQADNDPYAMFEGASQRSQSFAGSDHGFAPPSRGAGLIQEESMPMIGGGGPIQGQASSTDFSNPRRYLNMQDELAGVYGKDAPAVSPERFAEIERTYRKGHMEGPQASQWGLQMNYINEHEAHLDKEEELRQDNDEDADAYGKNADFNRVMYSREGQAEVPGAPASYLPAQRAAKLQEFNANPEGLPAGEPARKRGLLSDRSVGFSADTVERPNGYRASPEGYEGLKAPATAAPQAGWDNPSQSWLGAVFGGIFGGKGRKFRNQQLQERRSKVQSAFGETPGAMPAWVKASAYGRSKWQKLAAARTRTRR